MHNRLSDMDLQTRPLKSCFHFLAITFTRGGRCLCAVAGAERVSPMSLNYVE